MLVPGLCLIHKLLHAWQMCERVGVGGEEAEGSKSEKISGVTRSERGHNGARKGKNMEKESFMLVSG